MTVFDWIPLHKCVFCGCTLNESHTSSICPACLRKWKQECAKYEDKKIVLPLNCRTHTFLGGYVRENDEMPYAKRSLCRELVLSLKEERRPNAVNFIAWEMAQKLAARGLDFRRDSFICGVPRSPKKVIEFGFDQSELIARRLSEYTGIEYIPVLKYTGSGRSQKTLNAEDRFINAENSYGIRDEYIPYCALKRCILVDDVLTTAATVQACAALLTASGVRATDVLTAAKTFRSDD